MYWFLIPIFFFLAFFCKQTPAAYVILLFTFIFFLFAFYNKNFRFLIPIIYGSILSLILLFAFIWIYDVDIQSFFNQYFLYPRNIGSIRIAKPAPLTIQPIDPFNLMYARSYLLASISAESSSFKSLSLSISGLQK